MKYTCDYHSTISDINECRDRTANCPVNSYCVNSPGSYRCDCRTGYLHNTINNTCDGKLYFLQFLNIMSGLVYLRFMWLDFCVSLDVNECDGNNNNCFWGRLQCINTVGSYECRCPVGYRFSRFWLRCLGKCHRSK